MSQPVQWGPARVALERANPLREIVQAALPMLEQGSPSPAERADPGLSAITIQWQPGALPALFYIQIAEDWLEHGPDTADLHPPFVLEAIEALIEARWWTVARAGRPGPRSWKPILAVEWPPALHDRASMSRVGMPALHAQEQSAQVDRPLEEAPVAPPERAQAAPRPPSSVPGQALAPKGPPPPAETAIFSLEGLISAAPVPGARPILNSEAPPTQATTPSDPDPPDLQPSPTSSPDAEAGRPEPEPAPPAPSESLPLITLVELDLSVDGWGWHQAAYSLKLTGEGQENKPGRIPFSDPHAISTGEQDTARRVVSMGGWLTRDLIAHHWVPPSDAGNRAQVVLPGRVVGRDLRGLARRFAGPFAAMAGLGLMGAAWARLVSMPKAAEDVSLPPPVQAVAPSGCVDSNPRFVSLFKDQIQSQLQRKPAPGVTSTFNTPGLCAVATVTPARLEEAARCACAQLQRGRTDATCGESSADEGLRDFVDRVSGLCTSLKALAEAQLLGATAGALLHQDLRGSLEEGGLLNPGRDERQIAYQQGVSRGIVSNFTEEESLSAAGGVRAAARLWQRLDLNPTWADASALEQLVQQTQALRPSPAPRDLWSCAAQPPRATTTATGAWELPLPTPERLGDPEGLSPQITLDAAMQQKNAASQQTLPACWSALTAALGEGYRPAWPQRALPTDEGALPASELCAQVCELSFHLPFHLTDPPAAGPASWPVSPRADLAACIGGDEGEQGMAADPNAWPPIRRPWQGVTSAWPTGDGLSARLACTCHLLQAGYLPTPDGLDEGLISVMTSSAEAVCDDALVARLAPAPDWPASGRADRQSCAKAALVCGLSELLALTPRGYASTRYLLSQWSLRFRDPGLRGDNPWCDLNAEFLDGSPRAGIEETCAEGVFEVRDTLMPALIQLLTDSRETGP